MFMFRVCRALLSVDCNLVVTCCEKANLLALLHVMFPCVFITSHLVFWVISQEYIINATQCQTV